MTLLVMVIRSVLAAVLILSGGSKLGAVTSFEDTIRRLDLRWLPPHATRRVAMLVPLIELIVGVSVGSGAARTTMDVATSLLLAGLLGVSAWAVANRPNVGCRCFGSLSGGSFDYHTLGRAMFLATASVIVTGFDLRVGFPVMAFEFDLILGLVFAAAAALVIEVARALALARRYAPK